MREGGVGEGGGGGGWCAGKFDHSVCHCYLKNTLWKA